MKKIWLIISLLSVLGLVGCAKDSAASGQVYKNGTYDEKVSGYGGEFEIDVVIKEDKISEIKIKENNESEGVGTVAFEYVVNAIIERQTTEVDGVSGATKTSDAIKKAVDLALDEAKIQK